MPPQFSYDPPVEAFDPAVVLRSPDFGQLVLNVQAITKMIGGARASTYGLAVEKPTGSKNALPRLQGCGQISC